MSEQTPRPVKNRLLKAVADMNAGAPKQTIRTWDREVNIKPSFVGHTFAVFNGRKFVRFTVNESMVGKRLADFAPLSRPTATLKYSGIPARKMRLVAQLVIGLPVEKALNILNFTTRYAALPLAKMVKSAAANKLSLQGTAHLRPEDLYIKEIAVDGGPALKRIRMQSMGRVYRYRKPFSHVSILLGEYKTAKAVKPVAGKTTAGAAGAEPTPTTETAVKRMAKAKKPVHKPAAKSKTTKSTAKGRKK
jgi:large subunit ribosomal protein L22